MRSVLALVISLFFHAAVSQTTTTTNPVIGEDSCTEATACQNNDVDLLEIDDLSCNEVDSCRNNTGDRLSVGQGSCNSAKAISSSEWMGPQGGSETCSYNSGDLVIGNLGCTGPGSCSRNTQQIAATQRACSGDVACSDNNASIDAKDDACRGNGSCSQNGPGAGEPQPPEPMVVRVQRGGCGGEGSCRSGKGNALLAGCAGKQSCLEWTVDYATGANALQLGDTVFTVGLESCSGVDSCQKLSASSFTIGEKSCTGSNSCTNIAATGANATISIGDGACTEDNSCQGCSSDIPDGACDCNGKACKSGSGSSSSSSGSTSSNGSGSGPSGSVALAQRHVVGLTLLLLGFIGI